MGEGQGGGEKMNDFNTLSPSPQPSPARGEGVFVQTIVNVNFYGGTGVAIAF